MADSVRPDTTASVQGAIGQPFSRVDGRAKVTGTATYAAEVLPKNLAFAVLVQATIARGTIKRFHLEAARSAPGVLHLLTPENMPQLTPPKAAFYGEQRQPLSDREVFYAGQHVALVVADTPERARWAASLVHVEYEEDAPRISLDDERAPLERPERFLGNQLQLTKHEAAPQVASPGSTVLKQTYSTPSYTHNPMEMSATTAWWQGRQLHVWDSTQDVTGTRTSLAGLFQLRPEDVHVRCPFTGGGFGCKGAQWPHTAMVVEAARQCGRPVKLMLTRAQMFTSCGHRPRTEQEVTLEAESSGKLLRVVHESTVAGSNVGNFVETCGEVTTVLYATPNLRTTHSVRKLDVGTPTFMRGPGETPGTFAIESAMDELAHTLSIDPIELRLINYADIHPTSGKPWSSKKLRECYALGAQLSAWSQRNPLPGSMRDASGRPLGWGMATACYPALSFPGTARIRIEPHPAGGIKAIGAAASQDIGTGTWTIARQMTAAQLGLPMERVDFQLGSSDLPPSSGSSGSSMTASLARALSNACDALRSELLRIAQREPGSPFSSMDEAQVVIRGERLEARDNPQLGVPLERILTMSKQDFIEGAGSKPDPSGLLKINKAAAGETQDYLANAAKFAFHSFGAHFVQVTIDDPVPLVRVQRVISVMDVGRIINPKTARSQVIGGVVMGIGSALIEETLYDPNSAHVMTANLADYAVCVQPDVHTIEAHFIDAPDLHFNSVGCRGVGEIGITGVAAAIANAVFHATGKRLRELPLTPDKLL